MDDLEEVDVLAHEPTSAEVLDQEPEDEQNRRMLDPIVAMIPTEMWEPVEEEIALFLESELQEAESERSEFLRDLARWKIAYAAPMSEEPKSFPFANASNLTMPVIKESVNTLSAQVVQALTTVRPRWVTEQLADEWDPFIGPIEDFLDIASDRDLAFEEKYTDVIVSKMKLGTSIIECHHQVMERKTYRYTQDGKRVYPKLTIHKDGPAFDLLPLQKFWIRWQEKDIQQAQWVAKEFDYTEHQLRLKAAQGEFFNVEKILPTPESSTDIVTETEEEIENKEPIRSTFKIFEVWVSYPLTEGGDPIELKLGFHKETKTFVYWRFNPWIHGLRPFVKDGYFPVDDRFYDMGLCEMLEALQEAISEKHNSRSDNAKMANLKMFLKRKMVRGLMPGDPLYAGKQIEVNDIWNDIREFTMSEIYPSTVNEEMILRQTVDRLAGMSEAIAGSAMPVTRTGTGAQLALLQEQAKRIDIPIKASRRAINQIGFFTLMDYMQHGTNGKALAWMGEKGRVVEAVFNLPERVVELGLGMRANVPTSMQNKQVRRENEIAQFNLLVQLYEKLAPLAQMLAPEHLQEFIHGMVRSAKRFMQNTLESFDSPDPDEILAGITVLERVLPAPEDLGGLESYQRGVESAAILEGIERLEGLYQEAEATQEGRRGVGVERRNGERTSSPQGTAPWNFAGIGVGGESAAARGSVPRRAGGPPVP